MCSPALLTILICFTATTPGLGLMMMMMKPLYSSRPFRQNLSSPLAPSSSLVFAPHPPTFWASSTIYNKNLVRNLAMSPNAGLSDVLTPQNLAIFLIGILPPSSQAAPSPSHLSS